MQLIWVILFALSWIMHFMWGIIGDNVVKSLTGIRNVSTRFLIVLVLWLSTVYLCGGCPLSYVHEWIAVQAGWREKITYKYQDSIAYRYFFIYFSDDNQLKKDQ